VDNFLTGSPENLKHLLDDSRFVYVNHDVTQPIEVEGPLDFVLNFASPATWIYCAKHPISTLQIGALGTQHALNVARQQGAVFIQASSSEIYGDPEVNPQPETYWGRVNSVGPRSVYDEAKRFGEALAVAYNREWGLDVRVVRIFNTYGPRMRLDDGRVLPNFFSQALKNQPLTVYGDGSQTRSFCYVDDLVEGIYRLMFWLPGSQSDGGAFQEALSGSTAVIANLGNPDEVTILQLAQEVIEVAHSRSEVIFQPLPRDDPRVRRPDIQWVKESLGWVPKVPRREGLKLTESYFRSLVER
jgi:dTDP-glucose 4,6-dehydratase